MKGDTSFNSVFFFAKTPLRKDNAVVFNTCTRSFPIMGPVSSDRQWALLLLILTCATQRRAIVEITNARNGSGWTIWFVPGNEP